MSIRIAAYVSVLEVLRDPVLVQITEHLLPAGPAAGVLAAGGAQIHPLGGSGGGQHLLLLRPELARLERRRLLHRGQGEQLQQVVLDDVPGDADPVEVAGPAADADVLGHGDLHVVDVVVVPHRLEQLIGEAQRHQVLHRLLAQVVVDPEHRRGRENAGDDLVQLPRAGQVVAERLLDHHPAPATLALLGQPVGAELVHHGLEQARRDRQVERVVAARPAGLVQVGDRLGQFGDRFVVADLAGHEADPLGELLPDLLAERRTRVLLHRGVHDLGEVLVLPLPAGEPDQSETGGQQPAVGQVVHRGHQLLGGEVARDAEDDEHAGTGDPREAPVLRVAEWVQRVRRAHTASSSTSGEAPSPGLSLPALASSRAVCTVSTSSAQDASNFSTPSRSSTSTTSS